MSTSCSDAALLQGCLRLLRAGRLQGSYLIVAPEDAAAAFVEKVLAAWVCESGGADGPCGACGRCRRVAAWTHPDFLRFGPAPGESLGTEVVLDGMLPAAALTPLEAPRRVLVVAQAHRLTAEAQSRLLKALEEPPGNGLWFLLSDQPQRLHATILSRCQQLALPRPAWDRRAAETPRRTRLRQALEQARGGPQDDASRMAASQRLGEALRADLDGVLADVLTLLHDEALAGGATALELAEASLTVLDALEGPILPDLAIDALCDTICGLTPPSRLLEALRS